MSGHVWPTEAGRCRESSARYALADREGSVGEVTSARRGEWVLTLSTPTGITVLVGCLLHDPARTLRRVAMARR